MSTRKPLIITAVVTTACLLGETRASVIDRMSFEDVTAYADAIVVGTVTERPQLAYFDPKAREVMRRNSLQVDQYLKSDGAREIAVFTLGGEFEADTERGREIQFVEYGGLPQLPPDGTKVLLFLRKYGGADSYIIGSASHGVLQLRSTAGGNGWEVSLAFRRPEVMPSAALELYEQSRTYGGPEADQLFSCSVPVAELKGLVERVLAPKPRPRSSNTSREEQGQSGVSVVVLFSPKRALFPTT